MFILKRRKLVFALGVYAVTSNYFLHHPELLHAKKDKLKISKPENLKTVVIAHRGGSQENPENTLQAFQ